MENENPDIFWFEKSGKQCLRFDFGEQLTESEAGAAIIKWREAFESKKGQKIVLIWNCTGMRGYETGARTLWTSALKEMKSQIAQIWLISDSTFIRMGASVMGVFSSLDINSVGIEDEIVI